VNHRFLGLGAVNILMCLPSNYWGVVIFAIAAGGDMVSQRLVEQKDARPAEHFILPPSAG
jgi:hypothetical protein